MHKLLQHKIMLFLLYIVNFQVCWWLQPAISLYQRSSIVRWRTVTLSLNKDICTYTRVHSTHVGKHVHRHSQTLISTHIYKQRKCLKMYKTDGQIQNSKERERDMNKDRKVKLGIDNKVLPKTLPVWFLFYYSLGCAKWE